MVDVPAKLAARVRLFDTGHNCKTDAHSIANAAARTKGLRVLAVDGELEALQLVADAAAPREDVEAGPGGHRGATQESSAAGSHPHTGTSDQPLPGPAPTTLRRTVTARKRQLEPTG